MHAVHCVYFVLIVSTIVCDVMRFAVLMQCDVFIASGETKGGFPTSAGQ